MLEFPFLIGGPNEFLGAPDDIVRNSGVGSVGQNFECPSGEIFGPLGPTFSTRNVRLFFAFYPLY